MTRLKSWWNGREVLVNDGGYAPRLELRFPRARVLYEKHQRPLRWIGLGIAALVLNDAYNEVKAATALLVKSWL
jgi:hypothetical protein